MRYNFAMAQEAFDGEKKVFSSPEEELQFLRGEVSRHEAEAAAQGIEANRDGAARQALEEYAAGTGRSSACSRPRAHASSSGSNCA